MAAKSIPKEEVKKKIIEEGRDLRPDPNAIEDEFQFILPTGKRISFFPSKPQRVEIGENVVLVSATVMARDKTKFDAVLVIDEASSGEHCETFFLIPGHGVVGQNDKNFLKKLGKTTSKFFPYNYKYHSPLHCSDHHVGDNGWSK